MAIWNEIEEQMKELHRLLNEKQQLDKKLYNQITKEYDRESI